MNTKDNSKEIRKLKATIAELEKYKTRYKEAQRDQKESERNFKISEEQLFFSNALNKIAHVASSEEDPSVILEMSTAILGETLKSDRAILYNVDFNQGKLIGLSEWLNNNIGPTLDTYDISVFKDGINWLRDKSHFLESHADNVSPVLLKDGSGEILHNVMQIKSGLWMSFNFRENGFYILVFNQVQYRRVWQKSELDFLDSVSSQINIALQKIKFLDDLQKSRNALEESESKYRLLAEEIKLFKSAVEASTDAIGMATSEGRHYYHNESFDNMFGVVGPDPGSVYIDKSVVEEVFEKIKSGERWSGEVQMRGANNEIRDVFLRAYSTKDDSGRITNLVGVHTDITERKYTEKVLRKKEEKYRTLFELSPNGILLEDENGIIIDANSAFSESLGYKREEIIGKSVYMFAHPTVADEVGNNIKDLLSGKLLRHEEKSVKKDGTICYLNLTEKKITLPDGKDGIVCITEDITERRQIEKALKESESELRQIQKLEGIGQLAAGIAHDLNNILTVMIGNTELALESSNVDKKIRNFLEQVMSSGHKAGELISNILTFSRKQVIRPEVIDVNNTILNLTKTLHRVISEDIKIELNLHKNIHPVKADPNQIEQILINLVINAKDAIENSKKHKIKKAITIETRDIFLEKEDISQHVGATYGQNVIISVTDSGIGINKEIINRIFEPYFTTKEAGKGTGLGLSIVYGIVKQNNGSISVSSDPGEGTTIKIFWPAFSGKTKLNEEVEEKKISGGNETILFVEDDDSVRETSENLLKLYGYKILSASNGKDAIDLLKSQNIEIDMLITDVVMPEMGGIELSEKMKAFYPELKVLYCSGYPDDNIVSSNRILNKEVNFIPKPYTSNELSKKIREIFDSK
ncbi:MAG: PAS domain S-box protein [Acidobacteriota bacterium]